MSWSRGVEVTGQGVVVEQGMDLLVTGAAQQHCGAGGQLASPGVLARHQVVLGEVGDGAIAQLTGHGGWGVGSEGGQTVAF